VTQVVVAKSLATSAAVSFAAIYALAVPFAFILLMASFMGLRPCQDTLAGDVSIIARLALPLVLLVASITLFLVAWKDRRKIVLVAILLPPTLAAVGYLADSIDVVTQQQCIAANPGWLDRH